MPHFNLKWPLALALLTVVSAHAASKKRAAIDMSALPEPIQRPVKYFGDVHPILAQHCVSCHGPEKQKGGLRLDSLEAALAGGSSYGPAIVPGKSTESPLLLFTAHLEPDMEMPPDEEMLPEEALAVLRAWIDQGAKWPAKATPADGGVALGNQDAFFKKAATHWSFQPVIKADPHTLKAGPATIDSLIEAARKTKGLTASPRADARTLLKRLHFDTTGLPPAPEELDIFAADYATNPSTALERKVDELLASPHFGERWGRYWLDIARYADTQDFQAQADLRYPFAWTYRDYVISAFNEDKPYDQFLREQIAADQLGFAENDPRLAALGFVTVGPRFRRREDEQINDRIDVVTRGLMGLTVACARCHDHKYDPIPTADFYALYGVFNSTQIPEALPEITPRTFQPDPAQRADYDAKKASAEKALKDFIQNLKDKAVADILAKPVLYFDALVQMEVTKTADVRKLITGKKMTETALTPLSTQWAAFRNSEKWWEDAIMGPLARVAGASPQRKPAVLETIVSKGRVPGGKETIHPALAAALKADPPKDEEALVRLYGKVLEEAKKGSADQKDFAKKISGPGGWLDFRTSDVERAYRLLGTGRRELNDLSTAIAEVEATHPGAPPRAMVLTDLARPVEPVIFVRGDPTRKGDSVPRRFLSVLDGEKKPFPETSSGRKELAERITATDNPLTPRVWANQVWRHLLGTPLVKTTGDFGLQSEPPSHPQLLDWLASALMQRSWSTKQLVRDILLSTTYQQSSADRPEAAAIDPDNTHYWRANRRRMDFEAMRDAMLATSSQLDRTTGGRAVSLSEEPFSGRRTIYGLVDRVNLDPLFTTFDFPSPDISATERSQTLVPQQALFALNDAFIISQARALAKTLRQDAPAPEAIRTLYRRIFLRAPQPQEEQLAATFLQETAEIKAPAQRGDWLYGYGSADPSVKRAEAFTRLTYFDTRTKRYQGGREFPHEKLGHVSLSEIGGNPGRDLDHAAIRRWIAPQAGEYEITGELSLSRQNKGDGVRARLISGKGGLQGEWIADGNSVRTEVKRVRLAAGEVLDFAVDCRESPSSDAFRWSPTITLLIRAEETPAGLRTVWDSQNDFAPPPPPKLQPLEQVAHALLMTNEFLFVD